MAKHYEEFADTKMLEERATKFALNHLEFMQQLIEIRKNHGLTQEEVAQRMGISQPSVASMERYDSNPTLATIRRYALAVGAAIQSTAVDACVAEEVWHPLSKETIRTSVAGVSAERRPQGTTHISGIKVNRVSQGNAS